MLWPKDDDDKECKFDLLDDGCCYEILRRMPLVDLCSLSQTCVRLYKLCSKQFQVDYPSKVMYIEGLDDNGKFIKGPSQEKYIGAFDKSVRNIVLNGKQREQLATKLDVVNAYYNQDESVTDRPAPIKQIHFVEWPISDGYIHAGPLKSVETVIFEEVLIESKPYDAFLQYAPNIKHLKVLFRGIVEDSQDWLEKLYPKLESLEYNGAEELLPEKLHTFRRLNPTVRRVSLYAESAENITKWIENDVKVDELFFNVNAELWDVFLKKQFKAVTKLIKAQDTKVHLMIGSHKNGNVSEKKFMAELMALPSINLVGLYFPGIVIGESLAAAISTCENVRVLLLRSCKHTTILAQLAKLEEVHFDRGCNNENFDELYSTMRAFVGEAAKLKKMYVRNNCLPFARFDFDTLDRERMKLNGACNLKIYIDSKENKDTGKLDDTERTFNRIEIIRTSTEPPSNPLVGRLEYTSGIFRGPFQQNVWTFFKRDLDGTSKNAI